MIGNSNLAANKLFKNSLCLSSLTLLLSSMSDIYLKNIFTEDTDVLTKMNGILNKGCKPSLPGTTYHLFLHYRCYVVIIRRFQCTQNVSTGITLYIFIISLTPYALYLRWGEYKWIGFLFFWMLTFFSIWRQNFLTLFLNILRSYILLRRWLTY